MKTVGIIGGLGPETTAKFYLEIIFGCYEKNKESRPAVLIWNVPLKYAIEEDLILKASGEERYLPYLIEASKRLEKGGADFIVMPCNSLHIFIGEIRNSVKIPVLSIVEETANFLVNKGVKKAGILATSSLLKHRLYENALKEKDIEQLTPSEIDQRKIGEIINRLVLNKYQDGEKKDLLKIINKFKDAGTRNVILACTDLQLILPDQKKLEVFDTMKIFADSTINYILK